MSSSPHNTARTVALAAAVLVLIAALPTAEAQQAARHTSARHTKKKLHKPRRPPREERIDDGNFLRDPETLPVGSTTWWRAMDLRQRGGFGDTN